MAHDKPFDAGVRVRCVSYEARHIRFLHFAADLGVRAGTLSFAASKSELRGWRLSPVANLAPPQSLRKSVWRTRNSFWGCPTRPRQKDRAWRGPSLPPQDQESRLRVELTRSPGGR